MGSDLVVNRLREAESLRIGPDREVDPLVALVAEESESHGERLWCINCDGDRPRPLCRFSGDFLGDWHAEAGHAVDHLAGDTSLDLLCGQSPRPEAPAD